MGGDAAEGIGSVFLTVRKVPTGLCCLSPGVIPCFLPSVPELQFIGGAPMLPGSPWVTLHGLGPAHSQAHGGPEGDSCGLHLIDDGPHNPRGSEGNPLIHLQRVAIFLGMGLIPQDDAQGIEILLGTADGPERVPCEFPKEIVRDVGGIAGPKAHTSLTPAGD